MNNAKIEKAMGRGETRPSAAAGWSGQSQRSDSPQLSGSYDSESHLLGKPVCVRLPHLAAVNADATDVKQDGVIVGRLIELAGACVEQERHLGMLSLAKKSSSGASGQHSHSQLIQPLLGPIAAAKASSILPIGR